MESAVKGRGFSLAMFTCVLGFVLFKRFYRDLGDLFFSFVVIGTLLSVYYNARTVRKDPVFIAFFVSLIVPILSWANSRLQIPELAKALPSPFFFYSFFFYWFIAYWTQGKNERIAAILFTYCLSVLGIYISHSADFFGELFRGLGGARIDFSVVNAQYTSLFAGFGVIAAAFLFLAKINLRFTPEILKKSIATIFIAFFTLIVIITQSRQVWLALIACLFLTPLVYAAISHSRTSKRTMLITYLAFALIISAAPSLDIIKNRVSADGYTLSKIVNMDFKAIPDNTSIGVRIHLWLEGWQWIKERPILGSGDDSRELVISESERLPDFVKSDFTHLHNSHIETILSFGFVGACLVYFLILWPPIFTFMATTPSVRKTWKTFSLIVTTFWIVVNCFESYFYSADGIYMFSVFFGIIYSFRFISVETTPTQFKKNPEKNTSVANKAYPARPSVLTSERSFLVNASNCVGTSAPDNSLRGT
jgi:O-antigen ligase